MWNKRKDEDPPRPYIPPSPSPVAPGPIEVKKETTPVSSMPVPKHEPEVRGGPASIGKAVKIVGQIFSKEDLYVDGELEGTVEALEHKVTIGPNGTVKSGVKAREVVVLGSVHGNVESTEKMEIRKDAKLVGDVRTARIVIEDGAYFKGSIDIVKPEPKPAQKSAPSGPPIVNAATAPPRL
jgi:cytoskeletal protein CcmA (bactofilin family)